MITTEMHIFYNIHIYIYIYIYIHIHTHIHMHTHITYTNTHEREREEIVHYFICSVVIGNKKQKIYTRKNLCHILDTFLVN